MDVGPWAGLSSEGGFSLTTHYEGKIDLSVGFQKLERSGKLTKTETLEQAGINLRTAERYEELAGGREE